MSKRKIQVNNLARVEGEGALHIEVDGDKLREVQLRIFEPPRFFEALLRGRQFTEAPDITSRICGICPIAYLMSACHAMEQICEVTVDEPLRELRRLIYCGEWIESHSLHIFMLHLPDFFGYPDAIHMARDHGEWVTRGLQIKKTGNKLLKLMGGREVHPINVRVGGFYRLPEPEELLALRPELEASLKDAIKTVDFLSQLDYPDFKRDYHYIALRHPDEYPFNEGRLHSNNGIDADITEYDQLLTEEHAPYSTALQTSVNGAPNAHMGPMARYAFNRRHLLPQARAAAKKAGIAEGCDNPFQSIVVRAVEVVFAFEEALRIIDGYQKHERAAVPCEPRAGVGYGATEAPRGICYHRYRINDQGIIEDAKIVAPTSVNQRVIEDDLRVFIEPRLHLNDEDLKWESERVIRNYDPCISCSTHFLDFSIHRKLPNA